MTNIARLYRGQYRVVEEAAESSKPDHDEAMDVCVLEEVLNLFFFINGRVKELVNNVWKEGYQGKVRNTEEPGKIVLKVLKSGIEACQALVAGIEYYTTRGYDVKNSDQVPVALEAIRALHDDFAARWPFVRKEDVERGAREIAAGKFVTGEELLRELQGQSS